MAREITAVVLVALGKCEKQLTELLVIPSLQASKGVIAVFGGKMLERVFRKTWEHAQEAEMI